MTFCTFRILFSWALLDFSHLFARFQVECHERACSSGSLAGQVAFVGMFGVGGGEGNWSLGLLISRLGVRGSRATYPLSFGARN